MIIAKFGGTSVSTATRITTLVGIIQGMRNEKPVVVVSAVAGVTNLLLSLPASPKLQQRRAIREIRKIHKILIEDLFPQIKLRQQLTDYIDKKVHELEILVRKNRQDKEHLDMLASFGEILSSRIVAAALNNSGILSEQILATTCIVTNDNFGSAEFLPVPTEKKVKKVVLPLVKKGIVPVVTGFIGATQDGRITTLGRGGSDYSASILGFILGAKEIQIWTDVDGIFTSDPRMVKDAQLIDIISFKEASELATFGARVLHPKTIKPAIKAGIPVKVLNSLNPEATGTLIAEKPNRQFPIRAVCAKPNISLVNIYSEEMLLQKGFLAKVFSVFARYEISIDLVSVSEVSLSVTLDNDEMLEKAANELREFSSVTIKKGFCIVSVIGDGIAHSIDIIQRIFAVLTKEKIEIRMASIGATDINISFVIDNDNMESTVQILHNIITK